MKKWCRIVAAIGGFLSTTVSANSIYSFTDITFTTPNTFHMQGRMEITQEAVERGFVDSRNDVISFFFVANNAVPIDSERFADTFFGRFVFDIIDDGNLLAVLEDIPTQFQGVAANTLSESVSLEGDPSGNWIADFRSDNPQTNCFVAPWCGATGVWRRVPSISEPGSLALLSLALGLVVARKRYGD